LQEIYQQAPGPLREDIAAMALAGDLSEGSLERMFRARQVAVVDAARDLGFLSTVGEPLELHPLVKSFVLDKLAAEGRVDDLIRPAAIRCLREERWERAFELIGHFDLSDLVEEAIELAYGPLVRRGQLGTLSAFAARVRTSATFPPPVADLVDAEIALRDGAFRLARQIADRVQVSLPPRHPLGSKANAIVGHSAFAEADVQEVDRAYRRAYELARSDDDRGEVLRFWALASVQTEVPGSSTIVAKLATRRHLSPLDLLRYETVELVCQHFAGGTIDLQRFDEGLHVLAQAEDPRARSSFANAAAYLSMLAGDYDRASELMTLADADIESYDLDFARPHSHCNNAFIALGKRQFAKADRLIRRLEDLADRYPVGYHVLNARVLRARLAMQTNQIDTALAALAPAAHESAIPSIHGEYLATRALAMAIAGNAEPAEEAADAAAALTSATEVQVLISAVRAVKDAKDGEPNGAVALWDVASKANVWDPVVLSARASAPLAGALAKIGGIKSQLERLYDRSSDQALARKAGLRIRTRREPKEVLSPREFEVLELLARGYRSRDIAEALVISPSTTKVHIRHIMEKLGVRTRAEAVARASLAL
jgi:DNA-binding NarL/FixJ family response regulator